MVLIPLFADLVRLEIELWEAVDVRLRADAGLALADFLPLRVVGAVVECRVGDVAREVSITVGGASKCVDRLVARGAVVRRPHPTDRRSSVIALSPEGIHLLALASAVAEAALAERLGPLGAEDLAHLGASVARLREVGA